MNKCLQKGMESKSSELATDCAAAVGGWWTHPTSTIDFMPSIRDNVNNNTTSRDIYPPIHIAPSQIILQERTEQNIDEPLVSTVPNKSRFRPIMVNSTRQSNDDLVEVHTSSDAVQINNKNLSNNRLPSYSESNRTPPLRSKADGSQYNLSSTPCIFMNCESVCTASDDDPNVWGDSDEPLMGGCERGCDQDLARLDFVGVFGMVGLEKPLSTRSSSTTSMPICRICQLPTGEGGDDLISPCRCAGTMRFVHRNCLMKWLEVSNKRSIKMPSCELCHYQYHRHKKFSIRHLDFPLCTTKDKVLHLSFMFSLIVMVACATITVLCFKQEREIRRVLQNEAELTDTELVTLVCGILFFLAFFVAMYVEVKADTTIYKLIVKFFYINQQWSIDEYDQKKDHRLLKELKENQIT